jgi:hypothetical protein
MDEGVYKPSLLGLFSFPSLLQTPRFTQKN